MAAPSALLASRDYAPIRTI